MESVLLRAFSYAPLSKGSFQQQGVLSKKDKTALGRHTPGVVRAQNELLSQQ